MSTTTTNYNLIKPELTDAADITAMNTNWDTIDTLFKNLSTEGWLTPVTTENQDLNNYVTQGIYSFGSAYAPINRPDDNSNGWLIVIPWNNTPNVGTVKQIWLRHGTLSSNDHCLYVRTRISSNNSWSTWAQIYTSKDITANLADINALATTITSINDDIGDLQTQINGKQATITGAASTVASSNLTANRAVISNGSGKIAASSITSTELSYLSGVTSNVQTQLNDIEDDVDTCYKKTGGTISGNVVVDPASTSIPSVSLVGAEKTNVGESKSYIAKNANETTDYGTVIRDYTWGGENNGDYSQIQVRDSVTLANKLTLNVSDNGTSSSYKLYGEHNNDFPIMTTYSNKSVYHAFHKLRTVNGSDYGVNFGCGILGGKGTITMELRQGTSTAGTQLARFEIGELGVSYVGPNGTRRYLSQNTVVTATLE